MIAPIAFRVFFVCLLTCAPMVLGGIWFEEQITSEEYFKITATLFIVGLLSFLSWFSLTTRAILHALQQSRS